MVEVIVQESGCNHDNFISIVWDKDTTIWDYDYFFHSRVIDYYRSCWPVRGHPTHLCSPPKLILKILKPIVFALLSKEARLRILVHDASESELLEILSHYGIEKYMLPTQMGGTVHLDLVEWVASRRAIEMEDVSL